MTRCLLIVALFAACQHRDDDLRASSPQPAVEAKVAPTPVDPSAISGTVVETMNASTYTYARLDRGGSEIWVAGPQTALSVGAKLDKLEGQLMTNFHSNTLNRTFDQIYFVTAFGAAPAADPHAAAPAANPHASAPVAEPARDSVSGTVVQTMDAAGYTYAQLDHDGTKAWVAGPTTKLAVGTKLGTMSGSLMTGFHSNTLDRTFDQIYFVDAYAITH